MDKRDDLPTPVARLADARAGDFVWLYDSERNHYEGAEYKGRGVYSLRQITDQTKQSFEIGGHGKFDRKTGKGRGRSGYSSSYSIFGDADKADKEFTDLHRYKIVRAVEWCKSAADLKRIAEIVGYDVHG